MSCLVPLSRTLLGLTAAAALGGCVVGAPPGFGEGDSWSVPLVGALEDGVFIAPVTINGEGPYLFQVNPHSMSVIDRSLAEELDLYVERTGMKLRNSQDVISQEITDKAEIKQLDVGDLRVDRLNFVVAEYQTQYHGTPIRGTLGREILAESLIWTFDRDRSMLYIAKQGHGDPPADSIPIEAARIDGGRFFVKANLDGSRNAYVYCRVIGETTALWPKVAEAAGLESMTGTTAPDFFGRVMRYPTAWRARELRVGDISTEDVAVLPYQDKRYRDVDWDGALGTNFFSRFHVTVNWHEKTIWLRPRPRDLTAFLDDRLARWGGRFDECAAPACATAVTEVVASEAGAELPVLRFEREPATNDVAYEVEFQAVDEAGEPLPLPRLLASFPAGVPTLQARPEIARRYAAASKLRVIDATPFAPNCDASTDACVFIMQ